MINGDTIDVEKLGTVRYNGVGIPEIKHPSKPIERTRHKAYGQGRRLTEGKSA